APPATWGRPARTNSLTDWLGGELLPSDNRSHRALNRRHHGQVLTQCKQECEERYAPAQEEHAHSRAASRPLRSGSRRPVRRTRRPPSDGHRAGRSRRIPWLAKTERPARTRDGTASKASRKTGN